jgi:hypothetical protein
VTILHEQRAHAEISARVQELRPENPRRWGRMTIDQMVWHLNQGLLSSLGQLEMQPMRLPLPSFVVKPMVLGLPWPRGAPTASEYLAVDRHDFAREQERCLELVDDFTRQPLDGSWAKHAAFGPMSGRDWSRLMYKHMDHHLRQFSA